MTALPAVSKVVRVDIHGLPQGVGVGQNRLFFQFSGTLSSTDATTWLGNIVTAWGTFMTSRINSDTTTNLYVLTDLTSSTAVQVTNATAKSGGVANTPLSNAVSLVLKKVVARRYRGGHPRFYLYGLSTTDRNDTRTWDATHLGNIVGSFQTFINACIANTNPAAIGTITHVSVSYFLGFHNVTFPSGRVASVPTPRGTPVVDQVINITGNPVIASQRRRNEQP